MPPDSGASSLTLHLSLFYCGDIHALPSRGGLISNRTTTSNKQNRRERQNVGLGSQGNLLCRHTGSGGVHARERTQRRTG